MPIITFAMRLFFFVAMAIAWNILVPASSILALQLSAVLLKRRAIWHTDIDLSPKLAVATRLIVETIVLVVGVHAVGLAFGDAAKWITATVYVVATISGR